MGGRVHCSASGFGCCRGPGRRPALPRSPQCEAVKERHRPRVVSLELLRADDGDVPDAERGRGELGDDDGAHTTKLREHHVHCGEDKADGREARDDVPSPLGEQPLDVLARFWLQLEARVVQLELLDREEGARAVALDAVRKCGALLRRGRAALEIHLDHHAQPAPAARDTHGIQYNMLESDPLIYERISAEREYKENAAAMCGGGGVGLKFVTIWRP